MIKSTLRQSIPALLAYFPMGVIYGLLFIQHGYPAWLAPIFGLFVYAGAIQFLALTLLASGSSLLIVAISVIPLALRNLFYGLTMLERYESARPWQKAYLAQSLVDATYSLLLTGPRYEGKKDIRYCLTLSGLIHGYWILGILIGLLANHWLTMPPRLEFCLTAFFGASAVELVLKKREKRLVGIAAAAALIAFFGFANHFFLAAVICAIGGCLLFPEKSQEVVT